jgi:hypothetical protein
MFGYLKDQTGSFQLGLIMLGGFLGMAVPGVCGHS